MLICTYSPLSALDTQSRTEIPVKKSAWDGFRQVLLQGIKYPIRIILRKVLSIREGLVLLFGKYEMIYGFSILFFAKVFGRIFFENKIAKKIMSILANYIDQNELKRVDSNDSKC